MTNLEQRQNEMLKELLAAWDETETDPHSDKLYSEEMWERCRALTKEAE